MSKDVEEVKKHDRETPGRRVFLQTASMGGRGESDIQGLEVIGRVLALTPSETQSHGKLWAGSLWLFPREGTVGAQDTVWKRNQKVPQ